MRLTQTSYSDFVVWTPNEFVVLCVDLDNDFITKAFQEATTFFTAGILPELVEKSYTKAPVYSHVLAITDVGVSDSPWSCHC